MGPSSYLRGAVVGGTIAVASIAGSGEAKAVSCAAPTKPGYDCLYDPVEGTVAAGQRVRVQQSQSCGGRPAAITGGGNRQYDPNARSTTGFRGGSARQTRCL